MDENLFKTEDDISDFLATRPRPQKLGQDYAIGSLVSFPYENDELKVRV